MDTEVTPEHCLTRDMKVKLWKVRKEEEFKTLICSKASGKNGEHTFRSLSYFMGNLEGKMKASFHSICQTRLYISHTSEILS